MTHQRPRATGGTTHDRPRHRSDGRTEKLRQYLDHTRSEVERCAGRTPRTDRPERRRQIDDLQFDQRIYGADLRQRAAPGPGHLRPAALSDQPPRAVAQLSGHQRLCQYERMGKPALRRAVAHRPPLCILEKHRQSARGARSHRADSRRYQPHGTARRFRGPVDLRRAARAGDRHYHRRRRRCHPAGRADRGHEPRRNRARGRADPPPDRGPHAADRRTRHERGVWTGRPDLGAGVRPDHRLGNAGRNSRQSEGQGSLSRRGGGVMLEVGDLHAYYGKSHILQGVDMHIDAGEVVSLLGRNGVGRSTTVKAIMGEVPPQGSIKFKGSDIAGLPSYRIAHLGLGYVPEHRDIFPGLTVRQNLMLGIKDTRRSGKWRLEDKPKMFPNLAARADTSAGVLSGGEKQMLTICRTLMGDPALVMIDEPTEGLAPFIVQQVGDLIAEIARRGVAILLVEQKLSIAMRISHRVYVMGHGRIVFEGTPAELRDNEAVRKEWLEV